MKGADNVGRGIQESSVQTLVAEILAAWRRADRLSGELPEGTPEHDAAEAACRRLRDLYHDLTHSGVAHEVTEQEASELLRKAVEGL